MDPFKGEKADPSTQYLVPRPETLELDTVIGHIEEELEQLQVIHATLFPPPLNLPCSQLPLIFSLLPCLVKKDAFSDEWFLLERLTAREKEGGIKKAVLKDIDQQVQGMLVRVKYDY